MSAPPLWHRRRDRRADADLRADVIDGLSRHPKQLSPKYFYDDAGSELFEQITGCRNIIRPAPSSASCATTRDEIARCIPQGAALVEFGAGSDHQGRGCCSSAAQLAAYVPVDISGDFLSAQAAACARDFPDLAVYPVAADFTAPFALPDADRARCRRSASSRARRSAISSRTRPRAFLRSAPRDPRRRRADDHRRRSGKGRARAARRL